MTIEIPNFTRTPNIIYSTMSEMSNAELRVTLAIIRKTEGWHKNEDFISFSQLEEITGMTRASIAKGIKEGVERGFIKVIKEKGKTNLFSLNFSEPKSLVQVVNHTSIGSEPKKPKTSIGSEHTKETLLNKKEKKEKKKNISPLHPEWFKALSDCFQSCTGFMLPCDDDYIIAINHMIEGEIKICDLENGIQWLRKNGKRHNHPEHCLNSAKTAKSKREKTEPPKKPLPPLMGEKLLPHEQWENDYLEGKIEL